MKPLMFTLSAAMLSALLAATPAAAFVVMQLPNLTYPDDSVTSSSKTPVLPQPDQK